MEGCCPIFWLRSLCIIIRERTCNNLLEMRNVYIGHWIYIHVAIGYGYAV